METLTLITQIAAAITAITSALIVIAKPIRNKLMGIDDIREGQKCTLRAAIRKCMKSSLLSTPNCLKICKQ